MPGRIEELKSRAKAGAKCEACGLHGSHLSHPFIRTTNGSLVLCEQCLAEFNGKNPELIRLQAAIKEHYDQKADDRCWLDDLKLYAAAGLPVVDHNQITSPEAMRSNCDRFIACRMAKGHWPTYQELEQKIKELEAQLKEKGNAS